MSYLESFTDHHTVTLSYRREVTIILLQDIILPESHHHTVTRYDIVTSHHRIITKYDIVTNYYHIAKIYHIVTVTVT